MSEPLPTAAHVSRAMVNQVPTSPRQHTRNRAYSCLYFPHTSCDGRTLMNKFGNPSLNCSHWMSSRTSSLRSKANEMQRRRKEDKQVQVHALLVALRKIRRSGVSIPSSVHASMARERKPSSSSPQRYNSSALANS